MAVRQYREEAARRAVSAAERAVVAAQSEVARRQEELESYRLWRIDEENRRFDAIMNQLLSAADLDSFKSGLIALALAEQAREQALIDAEEALRQSRIQLDGCRGQLALARKDSARLETHRDIWKESQKREAEHKEDMEMEDFRPLSTRTL